MTETTTRKVLSITLVSVFVVAYAVFVIYLGLFAYGNPDPSNCFFIDEMDTTATSKFAAVTMAIDRGIRVRKGYPINMAHLFRTWFLWGFWDKIF